MTPSVESGGSEVFTGSSSTNSGQSGIVPAPSAGSSNRFLCADGTWSTMPDATTSTNGLMTSSDKSKLNGIASGANRYVHPSYTEVSSGLYKISVNSTGHVSNVTPVTKADITALGFSGSSGSGSSVTYGTGTSTVSGLTKLYTTTGTNTDGTMTQAAIKSALDGKAPSSHTHTKSQISDFPSSMPASDVYSWAKQSSKPTYTASEVGLGNVGNFKAVSTVASQELSSTEKANARANIGAGTSSFSGSYNDLTNKPAIPYVGNGTITITQNGTSKGTFSMNQSGNTTISLTDTNTDTWRPQPDWNATSGDSMIKNKPSTFPPSSHTHSNYLSANIGSDVTLANGMSLRAKDTSGVSIALVGISGDNNINYGYGAYQEGDRNTCLYGGKGITFHLKNPEAKWSPYICEGMSIYISINTSGYITNAGKDLLFTVPISVPIIGNPTVTISSVNGFRVRQNSKYLYGGSVSEWVKPNSYTASVVHAKSGIKVLAKMPNVTNVINNEACGIDTSINITFS